MKRAQSALLKMRCAPVEIAAAIIPRALCGLVFRLLPQRFSRSLADGRK
jgi:hypothetical protein